jgi:hypothetical protein
MHHTPCSCCYHPHCQSGDIVLTHPLFYLYCTHMVHESIHSFHDSKTDRCSPLLPLLAINSQPQITAEKHYRETIFQLVLNWNQTNRLQNRYPKTKLLDNAIYYKRYLIKVVEITDPPHVCINQNTEIYELCYLQRNTIISKLKDINKWPMIFLKEWLRKINETQEDTKRQSRKLKLKYMIF